MLNKESTGSTESINPQNTEWLDLSEAAAYLKLKPVSVYNLTYRKKIRFYKPNNGRLYFRKNDLDEYLLQGLIPSSEDIANESANFLQRNR